jgi:hypothetical protein
MGALVRIKPQRFVSFGAIVSPPRPPLIPAGRVPAHEPRAFPAGLTRPTLPSAIHDEMLELYAFIFCPSGFHRLDIDLRTIPACSSRDQTGRFSGDPRGRVDIPNLPQPPRSQSIPITQPARSGNSLQRYARVPLDSPQSQSRETSEQGGESNG